MKGGGGNKMAARSACQCFLLLPGAPDTLLSFKPGSSEGLGCHLVPIPVLHPLIHTTSGPCTGLTPGNIFASSLVFLRGNGYVLLIF